MLVGQAKKRLTVVGIIPVCVAVVGDLLEPIWNFSTLFLGVFALLMAIAIVLVWDRSRKYTNWSTDAETLDERFEGPGLLLVISLLGLLFAGGAQMWRRVGETPANQSVLAEHFTAAKTLQAQLGITSQQLASVDSKLQKVSEETKASRKVLGKISEDTQSIDRTLKKVKKETSDDPRKELANIGVDWSTDSFAEAIVGADMRVLELFLLGGMKPISQHKGASLAAYALQPGVPDRVNIVKLFMKYGYTLDTELIDTRIMATRRSLPEHFEHSKLSEKYGAWNKTFAGSALFWIVCIIAYEGASPEDYELIEFLVANGADTTLPLAYMKLPHRTTPAEIELRARLERLITAHR